MRTASWLASTPPTVAIEIASRRVTVVGLGRGAGRPVIAGAATEILPEGIVSPTLTGTNITNPRAVTEALGRALERAGLRSTRRAALVVPDTIARVSMLAFEEMPARPADRDQLIRWQLRKATPFPIEQAQVSYFTANTTGKSQSIAALVARRDVVAEYEGVLGALGVHAGLVDLASFSVMNLVIGQGAAAGDWLLVHLAAEATTLAILRDADLMFYRHRTAVDEEPLRSLVHQTAMYHEDRLGGGTFAQVRLSGAAAEAADARRDISARLNVPAEAVDPGTAVDFADRAAASSAGLDALAAPIGLLIRERKAA